jgi:ABC-2 type transport system ATP-binding protein
VITADGLTKRYGTNLAVDALSFTVEPGRVTGFLGPNGSGKSTTMRLMLGLDRPNAGRSTFNGVAYHDLRHPLREVGSLLDASYLHPSRKARHHLWSIAASNGIPKSRIDEVLAMVGLSEVANKRAGTFSLGMKQRLGLAGTLLGDPGTLILDEPGNGLDPEGIRWIRDFLSYLARQGRTVFVSSHLLSEMSLMADHLVVIGRGHLIEEGSVDDIVSRYADAFVRVRSPQMAQLADLLTREGATAAADTTSADVRGIAIERIGEVAASNGIVLHELTNDRGSLEDAFLALTGHTQTYRTQGAGALEPSVAQEPSATQPPPLAPGSTLPPPSAPVEGDRP